MAEQRRDDRQLVKRMRALVDEGALGTGPRLGRAQAEDGGSDLGLSYSRRAIELGRPLRPSERREVRRQVLDAHVGANPGQRRPTLRERFERMTPAERQAAIASARDPEARGYLEQLADDVDAIDAQAEFEFQQGLEDEYLAAVEDEPEPEWATEWTPGMSPAEVAATEHDAAIGDPWGSAQAALADDELAEHGAYYLEGYGGDDEEAA
jgi:hypothetical protein